MAARVARLPRILLISNKQEDNTRIINASVEILPPVSMDEPSILKRIERCGRICYKSERRITEDSAKSFVQNIITRGHEAVLEHGELCFMVSSVIWNPLQAGIEEVKDRLGANIFIRSTGIENRRVVSGNIRAWRDYIRAFWMLRGYAPPCLMTLTNRYPALFGDLSRYFNGPPFIMRSGDMIAVDPFTLPTLIEQRTHATRTIIFTCDRGVSHEFVRHRPAAYCQESTRYCNYSKNQFGGGITVIRPLYLEPATFCYNLWRDAMQNTEDTYFALLNEGLLPQEARIVLPNSLKTELAMTATLAQLIHFFLQRCGAGAHPQAREVATQALGKLCDDMPQHFNEVREAL